MTRSRFRSRTMTFAASLTLATSVLINFGIGAGPAGAAPSVTAQATVPAITASTTLPYGLGIQGANGNSEVQVSIPEGATPKKLTGEIRANYTIPGQITITVNKRQAARVDATKGGPVSINLNASDVVDGVVPLGMYVSLKGQEQCIVDNSASASLANSRLTYSTATTPPTTIASFLSPGLETYTVTIPETPTPGEQQAAFNAVAALTKRFALPTRVTLVATDTAPKGDTLNRVVSIREDATAPTNSVRLANPTTIELRGSRSNLSFAAVALGDSNTDILQSVEAVNLEGEAGFTVIDEQTSLADLGASPVSLKGFGQTSADISVDQPPFGEELKQVSIDLRGSVTQLPKNAEGRVDLLWNGTQISTFNLSSDPRFAVPMLVDSEALLRNNTLTVQLTYVPPGGDCMGGSLPGQLDVDLDSSTITPIGGTSVPPGFERLPQGIGGFAAIAFGPLGSSAEQSVQAANIVAALQAATPQQLAFGVWEKPEDISGSDIQGIVIGADAQLQEELESPVITDGTTTIKATSGDFSTELDGPIATLTAYVQGGRNLIVLGQNNSASIGNTDLSTKLASYANSGNQRWLKLQGQSVAMDPKGTAIALDVAQAPEDDRPNGAIVGLIAFLILVLALIIWSFAKPPGPAPSKPGADGGPGHQNPSELN